MHSPGFTGATAKPVGDLSLARVLEAGLPAYRRLHRLPPHQRKPLQAILACRTPALGGHRYGCLQCGKTHWVAHSCRNRHCPNCQKKGSIQLL